MAIKFLQDIDVDGTANITSAAGTAHMITLHNTTNAEGCSINFSDTTAGTQTGTIDFFHADSMSQGGGASFVISSSEADMVLNVGGRIVATAHSSNAEVDYGFVDDINTGMMRSGADAIRFVTGGTAALDINSSQAATFAGDITCGDDLFMPSAGVINFNSGDITLTHSANTLTLGGGQLTVSGEVQATYLDINGNADISGTLDVHGDLEAPGIYVGATNTSYDFYNNGTSYLNGATTIDANTQINGTLTVGVNDTGHDVKFFGATSGRYMMWDESSDRLELTDNVKINFGNGNDLSIYHTGSHSYIEDSGTGHLQILSSQLQINNSGNTENMITAAADGAVTLFNNGSSKLATTSTGISVTGGLVMTGNLTTGNGNVECNDLDVSGTITGDGSSIDSINAGNIASGTLAVARGGTGLTSISTLLNSNVTSVSGNAGSVTNGVYTNTTQTISGAKTFSNTTTFSGAISQSNTTQSTNKSSGSYKTLGGVGIAKTLNVGEDVVAYASSDERYKDNLQAITNPIDKVKSLTGYTFTWNDKHEQFNGNDDIGVVAQEVEKVFPEIVDTRDNGYKAVKYEKMVAVLIEAIKDQQKQIDELKEKCNGCSC